MIQIESDILISELPARALREGQVVRTSAGEIPQPVRGIYHAVGPVWRGGEQGEEQETLRRTVWNVLEMARTEDGRVESVSIPAISSGIFGFPKELCAEILFQTVIDFSFENADKNSSLKTVRFTNFDDKTVDLFEKEFKKRFE